MNVTISENLEFDLDMKTDERREILMAAATQIDEMEGHLGRGRETQRTPEALLLEALTEDVAEFPAHPVVHRVTEAHFPTSKIPVPATFQQLSKDYRFYWIYFPLNLVPKQNWRFDCLQLRIEFNPEEVRAPHLRPKAYQILPDERFQKMLEAKTHLEICLDENLEFNVATGALEAQLEKAKAKIDAGVDAQVGAGIRLVAGPFAYSIKRAMITHSPPGVEKIVWRIVGKEFFEDNAAAIVVIAQVPNKTRRVKIIGEMRVTRQFQFFSAPLSSLIRHLPAALRGFFKEGMPLCSKASWDITPELYLSKERRASR